MPDSKLIPEAVFEVVKPDGSRSVVQVTRSPFLIGRGIEEGNHLQLGDQRISRRAAALVRTEDGFRLEDRGQRNGVLVNGEQVETRLLHDADTITFGSIESVQLIFHPGTPQESVPELLSRLDQAAALEPGARTLRQLSLLLEATALLQSHMPVEDVLGAMVDRALAITEGERGLLLQAEADESLKPMVARQRGSKSLPLLTVSTQPNGHRAGSEAAPRSGGGRRGAGQCPQRRQERRCAAVEIHRCHSFTITDASSTERYHLGRDLRRAAGSALP